MQQKFVIKMQCKFVEQNNVQTLGSGNGSSVIYKELCYNEHNLFKIDLTEKVAKDHSIQKGNDCIKQIKTA